MMDWKKRPVSKAEKLVVKIMKGNDGSHDPAHVWRSGGSEHSPSLLLMTLCKLYDIGDYKYLRDPSKERIVENFLDEVGLEESKKMKILRIINGMGFKDELPRLTNSELPPEFGVVQDADCLDAIGAIGIAHCFTFGGTRNRMLHDPNILPRSDLSKENYMKKEEQTTVNHFHEKLLKLNDLMKTKEFLVEFYEEWDGRA